MTLAKVAVSLQSKKRQYGRNDSESGRSLRGRPSLVPCRLMLQGGILIMSLLALATAGHCHISIMPMDIQLQANSAGTRLSDDIEVMNTTSEPIHVTSSVMDWTMTLSGQKQYFEAGTQPNSCAKWIQMNPVEFVLAPRQSIRVRYSISAPADLSAEHWAMIFFTARKTPKAGQGIGLSLNARIGSKVSIAPAQKTPPQCKIIDMNLPVISPRPAGANIGASSVGITDGVASQAISETSTQKTSATESSMPVTLQTPVATKVKITVENPGRANIRLKGIVEARREDGQVVATGNISVPPALVLAGSKREVSIHWDKPLAPGTYRIKAMLDYGAKQMIGGELKATVAADAPADTPATTLASVPAQG